MILFLRLLDITFVFPTYLFIKATANCAASDSDTFPNLNGPALHVEQYQPFSVLNAFVDGT
ncbi:hypothetical protein SAMN04488136_1721 [Vibrio xiamenensis]|uniref:Uncharacterized protein n=1 Tax=Vibrio xiamenensis TaxID=861298 RepID=A0A1G8HZR1_9VIBR|nr:hypothetical protein SAMN04488136_1721 [Vibrio xiamenensis]